MTRINSAIKPANLTDQHLLASYREIPRIFTSVEKIIKDNKSLSKIPKEFTLGTGHCKFFYDKLQFLSTLYVNTYWECKERGFNVQQPKQHKGYVYFNLYKTSGFYNNYIPTPEERNLLIERISTRILASRQHPRYYSKEISKQEAIEILNR